MPENLDGVGHCKFDPDSDIDDDEKWKKVLGILAWYKGCFPHEIFDDPNWMDTIIFDIDIAMSFWNNVYRPAMHGAG